MKSVIRIVSLDPSLTEIVLSFGLQDSLVGVSHRCAQYAAGLKGLLKVTAPADTNAVAQPDWAHALTSEHLLLQAFSLTKPTHVLCRSALPLEHNSAILSAREALAQQIGGSCQLVAAYAQQLEEIYELYAQVGRALGVAGLGLALAQRFKAQLMSWTDNFYERMHNKNVVLLSNLNPPTVLAGWASDLLRALSTHPLPPPAGAGVQAAEFVSSWESIEKFRPDVLLIAQRGKGLQENLDCLPALETLQVWEKIPAVKRGEVIFCDGERHFYAWGPRFTETLGVLVSALAGFDSGYITQRDSFQRLRWAELHRKRK